MAKEENQEKDWRKVPIRITKIPPRITNESLALGLSEILGTKGYLTNDAMRALKNAGLGGVLESSFTAYVTKDQFLRAVKTLEDSGIIKHKPGYAHDIYHALGSWESWQKFRSRNIERRKKEYIKEDRASARKVEKNILSERASRRLPRIDKEGGWSPQGRAVSFIGREGAVLTDDGKLSLKSKKNILSKVKLKGVDDKSAKSSWIGTGGSGWSKGQGSGWRKEK